MQALKVNIAILFTLFTWASAFVAIRIGLNDFSPGALALYRFLVASLCMAVIYFYLPEKKPLPLKVRVELLVIGIAGIGIYNICLNYGELTVSAGVASFIIGLIPVFSIILSVFFLREKPKKKVWVGIGISMLGLILLLEAEQAGGEVWNPGVMLILVSAFMGAIYTVSQKPYLQFYHPVVITAWVMWGGTLSLLPFTFNLLADLNHASLQGNLAAIYMGIFPAALAYAAWCYVLNYWSVTKASLSLYSLPLLSTLMGYFILFEKPSLLSLTGGAITLLGAVIATERMTKTAKLKSVAI